MKLKLNDVVRWLIISDLIFYTGWGLMSPIFAVFLKDTIGLSIAVVGIAAAVQLIVRIVRIPFGIYLDDSNSGSKKFNFMFFGLLIMAIVPLGYMFSTNQWHIYILQAILGIAASATTAGFTSIFTRHMDKGKESTEWGIDATAVTLGPGIAGAVGGIAVAWYGFNAVFIAVAVIGVIGTLTLLVVRRKILECDGCNKPDRNKIYHAREVHRLKHKLH